MSKLTDKSIVITGATGGIGAAIARALAADGAAITVADLSQDAADALAGEITAAGGKAIGVAVDVRERAQIRAMLDKAAQAFGRVDVVFNNAGIAQTRPFLDITEEDWRLVTDVNALGVLLGMQEAVKTFRQQGGGGKIINTASIAAKQGYEPLAHYCASKFAVVAMTQAAARAFGKEGITANCFCPGVVATPMWDVIDKGFRDNKLTTKENEAFDSFAATAVLGRASQPADLVGVARYLASSDSDFMTGQSLMVDGGMVFI
ncbi:glucose 1-dehydrogenase [Ancylobacter rudongensis]|uniref:Meso-butanediol dehydrogenase / (S,S)-butanediol dehydrogenase / diacetyl reductase n=1 Tax=Ancylobacter rudongensis TaxID=177413 RepID=A0A1G4UC24_9HYPH|nr:glucose 1-dehydrogenase [Ancylobacter rudongensis]SCW91134.1 meso-butanediol dehydrogenase / (S,S)-butanediol dehydrogenase / diacetyl reductase [Ancylobacter rudongensis]